MNQTVSTCLFAWFFSVWGYHVVPKTLLWYFVQQYADDSLGLSKGNSSWNVFSPSSFLHDFLTVVSPWPLCLLSSYSESKWSCCITQRVMLCTQRLQELQFSSVYCFALYLVCHCIYVSLHGTAYLRLLLHKGDLHCIQKILTCALRHREWECIHSKLKAFTTCHFCSSVTAGKVRIVLLTKGSGNNGAWIKATNCTQCRCYWWVVLGHFKCTLFTVALKTTVLFIAPELLTFFCPLLV